MKKQLVIRGYFKNGKTREVSINQNNDLLKDIISEYEKIILPVFEKLDGLVMHEFYEDKNFTLYTEKENLNKEDTMFCIYECFSRYRLK